MTEIVDYEHLEPIPTSYAFAGIVLSVAFFQTLSQILPQVGYPKAVGREDYWRWRNLVVSWTHALIVAVWDIICVYRYPEIWQDPIAYHNMYIYVMVSFSTGYFIHDMIDVLLTEGYIRDLINHHIAIIALFIVNLVFCRYISYSAIGLICEVNSVFLHLRKLLQMAGVPFTHLVYRINVAVNLITFICFRFITLLDVLYTIVFNSRVGWAYMLVVVPFLVVMYLINGGLFWRLLCSDVLRKRQPKQTDETRQALMSDRTVPASSEDVHHPANSVSTDGIRATNSTRYRGIDERSSADEK